MYSLQDELIIDVEDSRNIVQSYNRCSNTSQTITSKDACQYMGYVVQTFTPGCEDLLPSAIDSSFRILWNTLSEIDGDTASKVTQGYGVYFGRIFDENLKPSRSSSSSELWRYELVDVIIGNDIMELIFRVAFKLSESQAYNTEQIISDHIKKLFETMVIFWEKIVEYTPERYFEQQLIESGNIDYLVTSLADLTDRLYARTPSTFNRLMELFSILLARAATAVAGVKWAKMQHNLQFGGTCNYPRLWFPPASQPLLSPTLGF
ncbi:unnamed protein product [Rhizoctonia solani]|uniref:Uncharacterized protein n=1 Tax=Rhizoctonia solani TaxID=456999 RepID=A0A8H2WP08_9AGAM|nr:unnamed protein product [Rhizoctonia solani]